MDTLSTAISKIWGMTRYEMKMHWRRRPLLVLNLVILVLVGFTILMIGSNLDDFGVLKGETQALTDLISFSVWAPLGVLLAMISPVLVADAVPIDRHVKMAEMLNSYPLPQSLYLAGKIGGIWLALSLPLIGMAAVSAVIWRGIVGDYNLLSYLEVWLIGGISLVCLNSGLTVLLGASQPTRRRAALVALGVISLSFIAGFHTDTWWDYVNPLRALLLQYFLLRSVGDADFQVTGGQIALVVLVGLAELLVVGWGMSRWLSRPA